MGHLYRQTGRWAESTSAFRTALEIAINTGGIHDRARNLNNLAFVLWLADHYQEAYKTATELLRLAGLGRANERLPNLTWA
jgi:Flp pilus assembly protein TadD